MRFAITGAAGYIAPRHLTAIKDTGNQVIAALDPHDSVGILDQYGFNVQYFDDFERFDRFIYKQRLTTNQIDYVSVCSPNYLHEAHARSALRAGASAIVEKPLVVNPENLALLEENETTAQRVYAILQMRYHPEIQRLKALIESQPNKLHRVELKYFTSRGPWYQRSWKGDPEKSGGLLMNVGIHLFDLLLWIFGDPVGSTQSIGDQTAYGETKLEHANINWTLSIHPNASPNAPQLRQITVNNQLFDFSIYAGALHTKAYQEILAGRGFEIMDARPALEFVHSLYSNYIPER